MIILNGFSGAREKNYINREGSKLILSVYLRRSDSLDAEKGDSNFLF